MTNFQKLIGISLFVIFFLFYWFQIRPSQIRSSCVSSAMKAAADNIKTKAERDPTDFKLQDAANRNLYSQKDYDNYYKICLQQKGL